VKVLIAGASGQVGHALQATAPTGIELRALSHEQLDISDGTAVWAAIDTWQPDLVVNTAAFTSVDRAESEPRVAFSVNAEGPRHLALAVRQVRGCRLIHISTNYVFDGSSSIPYRPAYATRPLSTYGRSKLAGEQAVLEVLSEAAVILRTAWVYAARGNNFLQRMLRLMRDRQEIRVVSDQFGSPTSAVSVAEAIWALSVRPGIAGIVHWADAGVASWYDFAVAIAEEGSAAGLLAAATHVSLIVTADYPTPASRPLYSVLDTEDASTHLGLKPTAWRVRLRATIRDMQSNCVPSS